MPKSIYIQLDFFHAGAWQAAGNAFHAESYAHDRDYFYLVLQPFLIAGSAKALSPSLSEYLKDWTGATLAEAGRLVPLDETLINGLNTEGTFTATPVPFPPGTSFSLKLSVTSVPATPDLSIARTLEGIGITPTPAFVLDAASWPEFAARNYLNIPILVWDQFTPSQRSQILDWVYGLMIALRRKSDAGALSDKEALVWNKFFNGLSPTDGSKDSWRPLLEIGNPPLAMNVLSYLYDPNHTSPGDKNLNPPQYMHTPDSIRQFKAAAFPVAPPATYHSLLWSTFADMVAKGGDERAVAGALGRYYGFGERLRWPKAAVGQEVEYFKHFMVVQPTDKSAAEPWFVTNAHSLAGQVFRVGPIADSVQVTGVNVTEFNVQGSSIVTGGAANPYQTHFLEMLTEARALRASGQIFSATLDRDPTNPAGRVIFTPRNAYAQDSALQIDDALGAGILLQVPGSLLDALDPRARIEFPADSSTARDSISRRYPQRKLIRKEELANDFTSVEWHKVSFLLQAKMDLVELSLATGPGPSPGRLYELRLSGEWHGDDLPFVTRALRNVNEDSTASIWVQQASPTGAKTIKSFSLKGNVLESRVDGEIPILIVNDKNDILAGLLPVLNAPPKTSASPVPTTPQKFYSVDFACDASKYWIAGNSSFNSLFYSGNKAQDIPALILASHFQHQVSLCGDRLLERFPLKLDPPPPRSTPRTKDEAAAQPLLSHFANFNKLRLLLLPAAEVGLPVTQQHAFWLTYPSSLTPLRALLPGAPDNPTVNAIPNPLPSQYFSYWVQHHFSEEARVPVDDPLSVAQKTSPQKPEDSRYLMYRTAGQKWLLLGMVEHQYSVRIPAGYSAPLLFPCDGDVTNLASLTVSAPANAEQSGLRALTFGFTENPDELNVRLNRPYFQKALIDYQSADSNNAPSRLRAIYEALCELEAACAGPDPAKASLRLERWSFNNTKIQVQPAAIADPRTALEFPGITDYLQIDQALEFPLNAAEIMHWLGLLGPTFDDFAKNLSDAAGAAAGQGPWKPVVFSTGAIAATTSVLRCGLNITRPSNRAIPASFVADPLANEDKFVPLAISDQEVINGRQIKAEERNALMNRLAAPLAQADLKKYVAPSGNDGASPLHSTFAWIDSDSVPGVAGDSGRPDKLFGELTPFLGFPSGAQSGSGTVLDVYYVPHAFLPLRAHPKLQDPDTTLEFAEYLMQILAAIQKGLPDALNDLISVAPADTATAWTARRDASALSVQVAANVAKLLTRVDPKDPPTTPPPTPADVDLLKRVNDLVTAIASRQVDVIEALLAADPGMYVWSKGVAIGILDPLTNTSRLYSLQVSKTIRPAVSHNAPDLDVDRFTFARLFNVPVGAGTPPLRFLVDVLSDDNYENDFEIAQNIYTPPQPAGQPVVLQSGVKIQRGACRARSGEDIMNSVVHNLFEDDPSDRFRSIEANVVHYNPEWRFSDASGEHRKYLLPSRKFPRMPKPVLPAYAADRITENFVPNVTDGTTVDLEAELRRNLSSCMKREIMLTSSPGGAPIKLTSVRQPGSGPVIDSCNAQGWHYLDSYLAHYFFVVEADEEHDITNDTFEFEVQRNDLKPTEQKPPPQDFVLSDALLRWFSYHRQREEAKKGAHGAAPSPPADTPALSDVLAAIKTWLVPPQPADGLFQTASVKPSSPRYSRLSFKTAAGWELKANSVTPTSELGGVIAADILSFPPQGGQPDKDKYVLHVAVLDDAWQYTQVRARVLRNLRDENDDNELDIDPRFIMDSGRSDWVCYGRDVRRLGVSTATPIPPPAAKLAITKLSLGDWINTTETTTDFGPILSEALGRTYQTTTGQMTFWNLSQIRSANFKVSGIVQQPLPDYHPRQMPMGSTQTWGGERGDVLTRQFLSPSQLATQIDVLTARVEKVLVKTAFPLFQITWELAGGSLAPIPLLEVTWPVEWKNK